MYKQLINIGLLNKIDDKNLNYKDFKNKQKVKNLAKTSLKTLL